MKKRSAKGPEGREALLEAEIEQTVSRLVESLRDFLVLLVRLSRERLGSGGLR
jgi:hypothetical protein